MKRFTKSAPESLSTSYLIGSAFIGISITTLKSSGTARPELTRSRPIGWNLAALDSVKPGIVRSAHTSLPAPAQDVSTLTAVYVAVCGAPPEPHSAPPSAPAPGRACCAPAHRVRLPLPFELRRARSWGGAASSAPPLPPRPPPPSPSLTHPRPPSPPPTS